MRTLMWTTAAATLAIGVVVGGGCSKDPKQELEDAVFEKLTCEEIARPSTLARIRAAIDQPNGANAAAVVMNPQDIASLVGVLGPEAEGGVILLRNAFEVSPKTKALLMTGWDGVGCGDAEELQCTAGSQTVAVDCEHGAAGAVDVVLDQCVIGTKVFDGAFTLVKDGETHAHVIFDALSINETKVITGDVRVAVGGPSGFDASVRTDDALKIVDFGGLGSKLECGEELRVDTLAFTMDQGTDDDVAVVELRGFHATKEETFGVSTFGDNLRFSSSCACPLPGSGLQIDIPQPLGKEGLIAHAKVAYSAPSSSASSSSCAQATVTLDDWPQSCTGLGDDCGQEATASTLSALLSAFCMTP